MTLLSVQPESSARPLPELVRFLELGLVDGGKANSLPLVE